MSDGPVFVDLTDPDEGMKPVGRRRRDAKVAEKSGPSDKPSPIPTLPEATVPLSNLEVRGGISNRDRAIVSLKIDGASFAEIADLLEIESIAEVKRAFERTIAMTHGPEEYETLRMTAAARLEALVKRSMAMASADYLLDTTTGLKLPNTEKRQWHAQAGADVMMLAQITGAKAPTRVEITPDEARMESLTAKVLAALGETNTVLDAEVIELDVIPSGPSDPEEL